MLLPVGCVEIGSSWMDRLIRSSDASPRVEHPSQGVPKFEFTVNKLPKLGIVLETERELARHRVRTPIRAVRERSAPAYS